MINDGIKVIQSHLGMPLYEETDGLLKGQLASMLFEDSKFVPEAEWLGSHIPSDLIRQCASFALCCAETYGGEVQGRFYYDQRTREWATAVAKQYVSRTLESQEIKSDGNVQNALGQLPKGRSWTQMGTWHSHADSAAFQSSTDYTDEIKQNGIHITLGNLLHKSFTIHTRITHLGVNYVKGDGFTNECLPPSDKIDVSTKSLEEFPELWFDQLEERPKVQVYKSAGRTTPVSMLGRGTPTIFDDIDISDDKYRTIKDMFKIVFPNEDFAKVCRQLGNMSAEQLYYQASLDFGEIDYTDQQFACIYCGENTSNDNCVCNECEGFVTHG